MKQPGPGKMKCLIKARSTEGLMSQLKEAVERLLLLGRVIHRHENFPVDPYCGGVDWVESLRIDGVEGLRCEFSLENVVWSHTELTFEIEGSDEALVESLRHACEPVIDSARLHPC